MCVCPYHDTLENVESSPRRALYPLALSLRFENLGAGHGQVLEGEFETADNSGAASAGS